LEQKIRASWGGNFAHFALSHFALDNILAEVYFSIAFLLSPLSDNKRNSINKKTLPVQKPERGIF
jgi:hypothetical protein